MVMIGHMWSLVTLAPERKPVVCKAVLVCGRLHRTWCNELQFYRISMNWPVHIGAED